MHVPRHCQHKRQLLNRAFSRWKSSVSFESNPVPAFSIEEIHVPLQNKNYLAGKLWKVKHCSDNSAASKVVQKSIPPIICSHGWLDNASSFDPLLERILRPNMTAFAFDLPGHGFSSHSDSDYDLLMDGFMSISRIRKFFNWDKVVLLGHSAGAVASFFYSSIFPESIHSYIALDNLCPLPTPSLANEFRRFHDSILKVEEKLEQELPPFTYTYEDILQKLYLGRENSLTEESCKIILRRGAVQRSDGKYCFTHDLRATTESLRGRFHVETVNEMCSKLTFPVCIIKGEPGKDYVPREVLLGQVETIRKSNPSPVEFHLVPGTHHFHLNSPELVAPIINDFIWK